MLVFNDYAGVNEKILEGYTIAKIDTGINAEDTGMLIELERVIDNVTLGIIVIYNPNCEKELGETEFMVSNEYVKNIIPETPKGA